jgi:hypothetical protein
MLDARSWLLRVPDGRERVRVVRRNSKGQHPLEKGGLAARDSAPYSITSSTRARNAAENSAPRAFAVFEIDDQIKLGRLLNRHVGWLRTTQDLVHIIAGASEKLLGIRSI